MKMQTYATHRRYVIGFHVVLFFMLLLTAIGSIVNLVQSVGNHDRLYNSALIVAMNVALLLMFWYMRVFPLRAQDRAIRAEENFRHFVLTGKPLDSRLSMKQIIALRFAADDEFVALATRAVNENLDNDAIKKQIRNWRADHHRA